MAQPLRIVQLSDIHCGEITFNAKAMESIIEQINEMQPDLAVVAGDLTAAGYEWEFAEAADWLDQIECPTVVIPGNHDARNVGYMHFEHYFGERFFRYRVPFTPERAKVIGAQGLTLVVGSRSGEIRISDDAGETWRTLDAKVPGILAIATGT